MSVGSSCSCMAVSHRLLRVNALMDALNIDVLLTDTAFTNPQLDKDVPRICHLPSKPRCPRWISLRRAAQWDICFEKRDDVLHHIPTCRFSSVKPLENE